MSLSKYFTSGLEQSLHTHKREQHMGCPHWVSRQCWAFILGIVLLVFMIISIALPWYGWVIDVEETLPTNTSMNVDGALAVVWYWQGIYVQINADEGSSLKHVDLNKRTFSWSEMQHSTHVKQVYMLSMAFSILAFFFALLVCGCLMFCLIVTKTRDLCQRLVGNKAKWIVFALTLFAFLMSVLSWSLFFRFPDAMSQDGFCPDGNFFSDFDNELWCSRIVGLDNFKQVVLHLAWQPNFSDMIVDCKVAWAPSVGWLFAVIGSILLIPICVLIAFTKTQSFYERSFAYERIHMKTLEY
jgi:hypothetical protein